jgi:hypothetical protein
LWVWLPTETGKNMTKHILEVVEFKLNNSVSEDTFLSEVHKTNAFVSSLKGFMKRHTAKNETGLWIDIVEWQDMESAQAAAETFVTSEPAKDFIGMLDQKTISMQHFEVQII